jgi:hypothetical protein
MRTWPLLAALVLAASAEAEGVGDDLSIRSELQVERAQTQSWADSPFNRVSQLHDDQWSAEWLPELDGHFEQIEGAVKPRLLDETEAGGADPDLWLNECWVRIRPCDGLSLQGGREVLLWGPAMFWNPSNPFYPENNRANPYVELAGRDFIRARWQPSPAVSLSVISEIGRGHDIGGAARRDAIRLDWAGESASAAVLASADRTGAVGWSGWTQWTANSALVIYGEAAVSMRPPVTLPETSAGQTGWQLENQNGDRTLKSIAGSAYTFSNGWTLNLEAWRDGDGLSKGEARRVEQATDFLSAQPAGPACAQLGALLDSAPVPYRRDYSGFQLMSASDAKTGWLLRYTFNLDDGSGEAVALIKRDLGDRVQVWVSLTEREGSRAAEFGRWVRSSSLLGLTWFIR